MKAAPEVIKKPEAQAMPKIMAQAKPMPKEEVAEPEVKKAPRLLFYEDMSSNRTSCGTATRCSDGTSPCALTMALHKWVVQIHVHFGNHRFASQRHQEATAAGGGVRVRV